MLTQLGSLLQSPLESTARLRMGLFLYCHATEMNDLYAVPMNLLRIVEGGRYSLLPFRQGADKEPRYPRGKASAVASLARSVGQSRLAELYEWMLVPQIRNAFFHSDYALSPPDFVIYGGRGVNIDGVISNVVPVQWLVPRLEAGVNLALCVISQLTERRRAYRQEKRIRPARAESFSEVVLTVDAIGLNGFRG